MATACAICKKAKVGDFRLKEDFRDRLAPSAPTEAYITFAEASVKAYP